MKFIDIIEKKKNSEELSDEEIKFWIEGVTKKTIPDYQTSALLMAIVINGMSDRESAELTMAMMNSGKKFDLSCIDGIKSDKHSTGGVGDKTTLILAPLVASCSLKVAKMSGRGLGHTGGTLDKLESIEGFNIFLNEKQFINQVKNIGISIIGQTEEIVPADKILYALRDVTATVNSIPLIASSIMSKKLALGTDTILLDVKFGKGAFMSTVDDARKLAKTMISIGDILGKNTVAILSDMNIPLGKNIGNSLEVKEAVQVLSGKSKGNLYELCVKAAEIMLMQGKITADAMEARKMVEDSISSGRALEKFIEMVEYQGGNIEQIIDTHKLPVSNYVTELKSRVSGYIESIDSKKLGIMAMNLGAGRKYKEDSIDNSVGLVLNVEVGCFVKEGDTIFIVHHNNELIEEEVELCYNSLSYSHSKVNPRPIIEDVLWHN